MSVLKVTEVRDLAGIGGFSFSSGTVTALGTLKVTDININGNISGSSNYNIPSLSSGNFLTTNGTSMSWAGLSAVAGIRSMQVWTSNGTWSRPSGVETIQVSVTGAGGGGCMIALTDELKITSEAIELAGGRTMITRLASAGMKSEISEDKPLWNPFEN